jgi:hypothetical protein
MVSSAAAAVAVSFAVVAVAVVVVVPSLVGIRIALLQLLSGRHQRPFNDSFLVAHFKDATCALTSLCTLLKELERS